MRLAFPILAGIFWAFSALAADGDNCALYFGGIVPKHPPEGQTYDWDGISIDCGPACLASVFRRHGVRVDRDKLLQLLDTNYVNGTKLNSLRDVARRFGFESNHFRYDNLEQIKEIHEDGTSVILQWYAGGRLPHYSVYEGHDKDYVYIMDPDRAPNQELSRVPLKDFHWDGTVVWVRPKIAPVTR